jgi:hypothetical protein
MLKSKDFRDILGGIIILKNIFFPLHPELIFDQRKKAL